MDAKEEEMEKELDKKREFEEKYHRIDFEEHEEKYK
jgi:hypothetical protein